MNGVPNPDDRKENLPLRAVRSVLACYSQFAHSYRDFHPPGLI